MKTTPFFALWLWLGLVGAFADDLTTTLGKKYLGVTITRIEPNRITIMTDDGIVKIPFTDLPKEVQQKYGYDEKKAATFEARDAQAQAAIAAAGKAAIDAEEQRKQAVAAKAAQEMSAASAKVATPVAQGGSGLLLDKPVIATITGRVFQRMSDGLIVQARGKGLIMLTGYDYREGKTITVPAVQDGTFDYQAVDGSDSRIDAWRKP